MVCVHDEQQRIAVQNHQTTGFDADDLFALHLLEFLVDALTRSPQQLRQLFLRQLQADANRLGIRQLGTP